VRFLINHLAVDSGFRTDGLLLMHLRLPDSKYGSREQRGQFYEQVLHELQALPGVDGVAATTAFPIWRTEQSSGIRPEGWPLPEDGTVRSANEARVSSDYFTIMGISLREGRGFTDQDQAAGNLVVIINEAMAQKYWPGESAVGKRLHTYSAWREIVGVVSNLKHPGSLDPQDTKPHFYLPQSQDPWSFSYLILRTSQNPSSLAKPARQVVADLDPDLAVFRLATGEQALQTALVGYQTLIWLLVGFATLGLILAAVGIYGVVSQAVVQRQNEMSIRMALGAKPKDVLRLVLDQGMRPVWLGLILGLAVSLSLSLILKRTLGEIGSPNLSILALVLGILLATAAWACLLPARRVTRLNPTTALRYE
jgi:predicted permease